MGTAQGIDILPLHRDNILLKIRRIHGPPAIAIEFMPVHALEHNALAIDFHDIAIELELPEADMIRNYLLQIVRFILNGQQQLVEMRMLCTPELDIL